MLYDNYRYNVAAMSVFQITIGQCFYFSLGVGIAVTTRVANKLGAGDSEGAKLASRTAICCETSPPMHAPSSRVTIAAVYLRRPACF